MRKDKLSSLSWLSILIIKLIYLTNRGKREFDHTTVIGTVISLQAKLKK